MYFLADQKIRFALSKDALHYMPLLNNSAIPDIDGNNTTSVRDPFLRWDGQSGLYRMVATDGYKFGHDATIWCVRVTRTCALVCSRRIYI